MTNQSITDGVEKVLVKHLGERNDLWLIRDEIRTQISEAVEKERERILTILKEKEEDYRTKKRATPYQDTLFNFAANQFSEICHSLLQDTSHTEGGCCDAPDPCYCSPRLRPNGKFCHNCDKEIHGHTTK